MDANPAPTLVAAPGNSDGVGVGWAVTVPFALGDGVALAVVRVSMMVEVVVGSAVVLGAADEVVDSSTAEDVVSAVSAGRFSHAALAAARTSRAASGPQDSRTAEVAAPWMAALLAVSHWHA